jgi:K+-sensing histidine kinase KdpD
VVNRGESTFLDRFITIIVPGAATLLLVGLATLTIALFKNVIPYLNTVSFLYLIPVILAAVWWNIGQAIFAAIAGALAADYFFYPPLYSFRIEDPQNFADLIAFLMVAVATGTIAARLRRRDAEIQDLYAYSRSLAACFNMADLIRATEEHLTKSLGRSTILLEKKKVDDGSADGKAVPSVIIHAAARISREDLSIRTVVDETTRHAWLVRNVFVGSTAYVIFVDLGSFPSGVKRRFARRIGGILRDMTESYRLLDLAAAIEEFTVQAEADKLKNALVATISHELRNPLVSILGATSVLRQIGAIANDTEARAMTEIVNDEASRLDASIKNIVDAARITTGTIQPVPELTDPVDLVRGAIKQRNYQLAAHHLEVSLPSDLPLVRVQSALIENAVAQILDNAAKYSPTGSRIRIEGRAEQDRVILSISDQGLGMTPEELAQAGEGTFRGARDPHMRGSGLGLWIANTFVAANGGKLSVESEGAGLGTLVRIHLRRAQ